MKGKKITNILDFLHTMRNRIKPFFLCGILRGLYEYTKKDYAARN